MSTQLKTWAWAIAAVLLLSVASLVTRSCQRKKLEQERAAVDADFAGNMAAAQRKQQRADSIANYEAGYRAATTLSIIRLRKRNDSLTRTRPVTRVRLPAHPPRQ